MKRNWIIFTLALVLLLPLTAEAHMLWLLPDQDAPNVNQPVQVEIGWGHKFPKDEEIKADRLGSIKAVGPDGQEVPLKKISTILYEFVPSKKGVYLIAAQVAPGFLTKTPNGFKLQNKKGVPDATTCFHFDMATKTLVNVGRQRQGFDRLSQSTLEIVPLKNPATVKRGAGLPVKVMFQGKPLAGVEVKVTHEAMPDPKKPVVSLGKTDAKGEILVKLDKPGRWLLFVTHKTPFEHPDECDENLYNASFAWRVR